MGIKPHEQAVVIALQVAYASAGCHQIHFGLTVYPIALKGAYVVAARPISPTTSTAERRDDRHVCLDRITVWTVAMLGAWPLCGIIPSMDWPQHVAIVDILSRLWTGDGPIATYYAPHLQPVAYHLLYVIATPMAVVMGTHNAARLVLLLLYAANFPIIMWLLARLHGPGIISLVAIPLFYGVNFIWGFGPTMVGTTPMLLALSLLCLPGRPSWRTWAALCASSVCATFAHIVFWPACCAASAISVAVYGRARLPLALASASASTLVALPGLWHMLQRRLDPLFAAGETAVSFEGFVSGWRHVGMAMRCIDRSWHQCGQVLCVLVVAAALAWPGHRPASLARRAFVCMTMMLVGLVWAIPLIIEGPSESSWLLNMRFVGLATVMAALGSAASPLWTGRWATWTRLVWVGACCSMALGTIRVTLAFRDEVDPYLQAVQQSQLRGRLGVIVSPQPFFRTWPPLARHMAAQAFVGRFSWQGDLFVGGHLPIVEGAFAPGGQIHRAAVDWAAARHSQTTTHLAQQEVARGLWAVCDALLVQGEAVERYANPPTNQAQTLGRGTHWVLLGPPARTAS